MHVHNVLHAVMEVTTMSLICRKPFPMTVGDINDAHNIMTLIVEVLDMEGIMVEMSTRGRRYWENQNHHTGFQG